MRTQEHKNTRTRERGSKFFRAFVFLFFCFSVLVLSCSRDVRAAAPVTIRLVAETDQVKEGDIFSVAVRLDPGGRGINALDMRITFDPARIQAVGPSIGPSEVAFWAAPPVISNEDGFIRFQGGIPSPGIRVDNALLATLTFRAKRAGRTDIAIERKSRLFLDDGKATEVSFSSSPLTVIIAPVFQQQIVIDSPSHPDEGKWYSAREISAAVNAMRAYEGFSWSFDADPGTVPDTVADGNAGAIAFTVPRDGIWYLHLRGMLEGVWGGPIHRAFRIDATAPALLPIEILPSDILRGKGVASFEATDNLSGIAYYEVQLRPAAGSREAPFAEATSPHLIPDTLSSGSYRFTVRAYDRAGNVAEGSRSFDIAEGRTVAFGARGISVTDLTIRWWQIIVVIAVMLLAMMAFVTVLWRSRRAFAELQSEITSERAAIEQLRQELAAHSQAEPKHEPLNLGS